MSYLLLIAASLIHGPIVRQLWSKSFNTGILTTSVRVVGDYLMAGNRVMLLATGDPADRALVQPEPAGVGYKLDGGYIVESGQGSEKPLQKMAIPTGLPGGTPRLRGDAAGKYLVVTGYLPDIDFIVDRLVLLDPMRLSRLPFIRIYDARILSRCLGVAEPHGYVDDSLRRSTPNAPLACGDGFTGKVFWMLPNDTYGIWLTPRWVLAHSDLNQWSIVDGRTGQVAVRDLPPFKGVDDVKSFVSDLHGKFVCTKLEPHGASTTLSAYEVHE